MAPSFVQALARAATQIREDHGVSQEQVAVAMGQSKDKVRYFEKAKAFGALDELLDAYSTTTGVSVLELVAEAEANLKKNG